MRPIDADSFKLSINTDKFAGFLMEQIIDMQPTVDTKAQWIPVAERLPEKYEDVLITYRIPNEKAARIWIGCRAETEWCAYDVYRPNVTAWMPLPEEYEPDGVKDEGE